MTKQLQLALQGESNVRPEIVEAVKGYLATHTYENSKNLPKEDWFVGPFKLKKINFTPCAGGGGYTVYPLRDGIPEIWSFDGKYHEGIRELGKKLGIDLFFEERELMGDDEGM
jgi:hypothetical protein